MAITLKKLKIKGKDLNEDLQKIESWAQGFVKQVEYEINHIDDSNMVTAPISRAEVEAMINEKYEELRTYIVSCVKELEKK